MHRFEKPILWLMQDPDVPDADVLTICGGEGAYFIQVGTAESDWLTASRQDDSSEPVAIWTSDQGFTTEVRFTWALAPTLEMVRWYFEQGQPWPGVVWV